MPLLRGLTMQKPLKARHRYDPFSPDLHSWRESTG